MLKPLSVMMVITFFGGIAPAQEIIRNPPLPASSGAGRVVTLKPRLTIAETGTGYYFNVPRSPCLASDGSIFVQDRDQLLEFDRNGRFVRNYYKKGQGPGEVQGINHYFVTDGRVYLQDMYGGDIVVFDRAGTYLREIHPAQPPRSSHLLDFRGGRFLLSTLQLLSRGDRISLEQSLAAMREDGSALEQLISFPVEGEGQQTGGVSAAVIRASLMAAPFNEGKAAVISHTSAYLVKVVDLESRRVICSFSRDFERVPNTGSAGLVIKSPGRPDASPPPSKYKNDIAGLFVRNGEIWVVTSLHDSDKGTLVDVFDKRGRFLDSFFLNVDVAGRAAVLRGYEMSLTDEAIVVAVKGEDDLTTLVVCDFPKNATGR
jgi:hypothetical protein